MKNLKLLIGIAVLAFVGYLVYRLTRSDVSRIRELVESMAEGFNDDSPPRAMAGLDESFVEETARARWNDVHQLLVGLYLTARDPDTKEFRYRVLVSDLEVHVEPDRAHATARFTADFLELRSKEFQPLWKAEIEGRLEKKDGWKVVSSIHRSISGRRPF